MEVCIEDLKVYEGWGQATKQPGVEGSSRGLTLSLLCDHCLLLYPEQQARVEHGEPLCTIGSLQRHLQLEAFVAWLRAWLDADDFADKLEQLTQALRPLFPLQPSEKHMCSRDLGRLEPTPGWRTGPKSDRQTPRAGKTEVPGAIITLEYYELVT